MPPYSESYSLGRKRVRTPPHPTHNLTFPVLIFYQTGAARKRAEWNGRGVVAGCVGGTVFPTPIIWDAGIG